MKNDFLGTKHSISLAAGRLKHWKPPNPATKHSNTLLWVRLRVRESEPSAARRHATWGNSNYRYQIRFVLSTRQQTSDRFLQQRKFKIEVCLFIIFKNQGRIANMKVPVSSLSLHSSRKQRIRRRDGRWVLEFWDLKLINEKKYRSMFWVTTCISCTLNQREPFTAYKSTGVNFKICGMIDIVSDVELKFYLHGYQL